MKHVTSLLALVAFVGLASRCASDSEAAAADTAGGDVVAADIAGGDVAAADTSPADTAASDIDLSDSGSGDISADPDAATPTDLDESDAATPDVTTTADGDSSPWACPGAPATTYACPGGITVPLCGCEEGDYACDPHPERSCPTSCEAEVPMDFPCSDGTSVPWCTCKVATCVPVCDPAGAAGPGWYDPCSKALVKAASCNPVCTAVCTGLGSKSEGWSDACTSELITWSQCAPTRECSADPNAECPSPMCYVVDTATFPCTGGGSAPFCMCMSQAADCRPKCEHVGTAEEGWYGGCDGKLIRLEACDGCTSSCGAIGSKSEGWYSSCTGLLGWEQCATGIWTCNDTPWDGCGAPVP